MESLTYQSEGLSCKTARKDQRLSFYLFFAVATMLELVISVAP